MRARDPQVAGYRYLANTFGSDDVPLPKGAQISRSEIDAFRGHCSTPAAKKLKSWLDALRAQGREERGGRFLDFVVQIVDPDDACPDWDMPLGLAMLLGRPVRYVAVGSLADGSIFARLACGPEGDAVAFLDPYPHLLPTPAETVWVALPSQRDEETASALLARIAAGELPERQTQAQNAFDLANGDVGPAPTVDELRLLARFSRLDAAIPEDARAEVDRLRRLVRDQMLLAARDPGAGAAVERFRFPADASPLEVLTAADMALGSEYAVIALTGVLVGSVLAVSRGGRAAMFEPSWNQRKKVPQFSAMRVLPAWRVERAREPLDVLAIVDALGGFDRVSNRAQAHEAARSWSPPVEVSPVERLVRYARKERVHLDNEAKRPALLDEHGLEDLSARWRDIQRPELEAKVWSMPTWKVALQYGVSDAMVGRVCDRLGVPKPPRGFWAKVQAGVLPHPRGRPTVG